MTEVMNSLEPSTEDFSVGGAEGHESTIFTDPHEKYPKLSKRLPSIVVEPTDGTEVESGELRWPPDQPASPDAQAQRQIEEPSADVDVGVDEEESGSERQESN